jgi:hypothetical protein
MCQLKKILVLQRTSEMLDISDEKKVFLNVVNKIADRAICNFEGGENHK